MKNCSYFGENASCHQAKFSHLVGQVPWICSPLCRAIICVNTAVFAFVYQSFNEFIEAIILGVL